ncbi:hypothetical protein LILAB_09250 [Corallococcus macrosporus]|uniref:Uncharacterized protein n=1 Tax=Myxococcus fulvus (strain ATCC BAA-855 / HW-1) TaxID=483219 RepID=F8CIA2_MYXFH|nr:hypothetical protein LILAB_09250 [Corallococcus macrosporus]
MERSEGTNQLTEARELREGLGPGPLKCLELWQL